MGTITSASPYNPTYYDGYYQEVTAPQMYFENGYYSGPPQPDYSGYFPQQEASEFDRRRHFPTL